MVYGICQKERNTNYKFVHRFLIRNVPHVYGLPLDLCGKRIAALFAKCTANFANVPRFHGLYKTAHFQELWHTQRDKRSAHGTPR